VAHWLIQKKKAVRTANYITHHEGGFSMFFNPLRAPAYNYIVRTTDFNPIKWLLSLCKRHEKK
jgi:hypothetical protein